MISDVSTLPPVLKRRSRLAPELAETIYRDYQRLGSLKRAGELHGRSAQALLCLFRNRGWQVTKRRIQDGVEYKGHIYRPNEQGYLIRRSRGRHFMLHRIVWTEAHGTIPRNYGIRFKGGDKQNCDLENLECLPKSELTSVTSTGRKWFCTREAMERVEQHIGYVVRLAYAYHLSYGTPVEDLITCGKLGIIDAQRRYKPMPGASFLAYAKYRIKAKMQEHVRDDQPVHVPANLFGKHQISYVHADQPLSEDGDETFFDCFAGEVEKVTDAAHSDDVITRVRKAIRALPIKLRIVVEAFYLNEQPQLEIAATHGITPQGVSSRLRKALKLLRRNPTLKGLL